MSVDTKERMDVNRYVVDFREAGDFTGGYILPVHERVVVMARDYDTLLSRLSVLEGALSKCIRQFENMDESAPVDAGCIECTAGTVPNNRNTGLCWYHAAKAALASVQS